MCNFLRLLAYTSAEIPEDHPHREQVDKIIEFFHKLVENSYNSGNLPLDDAWFAMSEKDARKFIIPKNPKELFCSKILIH